MSSFLERAASKFMANVSDDLLVEILLRLPDCQYAIQCSTVCKRWHSLISHPGFVRQFIHHHDHNRELLDSDSQLSTPTLLFQRHKKHTLGMHFVCLFYAIHPEKSKISHERLASSLSLSSSCLRFLPWDVVIRAAFDDLLLITRPFDLTNFYICNPLTQRWYGLPQAPEGIVSYPLRCALVCQPYDCSKELKCTTNAQYRYKVVLFGYGLVNRRKNIYMTIFSSETGQWSRLITIPAVPPLQKWAQVVGKPSTINQVVVCNGILYWIESVMMIMAAQGIVALGPFNDSGVEQCSLIALPDDIHLSVNKRDSLALIRLGTCKGKLRMSQLYANVSSCLVLKVWELRYCDKNASTSWSLVHNVALEIKGGWIYVLAFHPSNGNVVFLFRDNEVWRYDILEEKGENVGQFPVEITFPNPYISLFTLRHFSWPTPVPAPAFPL